MDDSRISVASLGVDSRFQPLGPETVEPGHPYKDVVATFRVIATLRAGGVDAVLVRAGKPLSPERSLASELGLRGIVRDLGFVSDECLVEPYNACDLLLFPLYCEGFGRPLLEAMACGLPIVSSDCAPLREVVGDAGLMAAPDDTEGLTDAVRALLDSAELAARSSERGRVRAATCTRPRTFEGYRRIYERVAEEPQEGA